MRIEDIIAAMLGAGGGIFVSVVTIGVQRYLSRSSTAAIIEANRASTISDLYETIELLRQRVENLEEERDELHEEIARLREQLVESGIWSKDIHEVKSKEGS